MNGGLNLAVKRAEPNNAGPVLGNAGGSEPKRAGKEDKNQRVKRLGNRKLQQQHARETRQMRKKQTNCQLQRKLVL